MVKHLLRNVVTVAVLLSSSTPLLGADFVENGIYYNYSSEYPGSVAVSQNPNGSYRGDITIPKTAGGLPVREIESYAFLMCQSLTSIVIPSSVTDICAYAFYGCESLGRVDMPSAMSYIGHSAFAGCTCLKSISLPEGIVNINRGTFSSSGLTTIFIPNTVTKIWNYAFSDCENLEYVYIPASVTEMEGAFDRCSNIKMLVIDKDNEVYSFSDGVLYDKEKTKILGTISFSAESLNIPESVTYIEKLDYCPYLSSTVLPSALKKLSPGAFVDCPNLENIEIPASNPEYRSHDGAIYDKDMHVLLACPPAKVLTEIPSTVTEIGAYALGKNKMTSSPLHEGVSKIGESAFALCMNLRTMTLPTSVMSVGSQAFYGCYYMTDFTFPDNVIELGSCVLGECHSLESVTLPSGLKALPRNTFQSCMSLKSIEIPQTVTSIGQFCFSNCMALASVSLPAGMSEIQNNTFSGCVGLKEVVLPESLTKMGASSFRYCQSLERIDLPSTLTELYPGVFDECENLSEIYCQSTIPPTCVADDGLITIYQEPTFSQTTFENGVLYVPEGCRSAYQSADVWCQFGDIREKSFSRADAIGDAHTGLSVVGGRIILADMEMWIDIYTPAGGMIYSGIAAKAPLLDKGVYIVSLNVGRAVKVAVK